MNESGKTVLIIDDDNWTQVYITNALEKSGLKTISAGDPFVGLNHAINDKPDLILLDIFIPTFNGDILLHIMKNLDVTVDIPVIILSGHLDASVIAKTYKIGAKGFITKPFTREVLLDKIVEVLGEDSLILASK
jgi:DNA-binding NtrC family response regulator